MTTAPAIEPPEASAAPAPATSGIRCPHCGGNNLADDRHGIQCTDCGRTAFIDTDRGMVRVDAATFAEEHAHRLLRRKPLICCAPEP